MEWPDILTIAAASGSGVGVVGVTIGLAFRALDKSRGALIEEVAGEYQVPSSEIKSILEQFKSDESRLKALELLLKVPRERAKDVLNRVKDAAPSVRRMYKQRSRYSLFLGAISIGLASVALVLPREHHPNMEAQVNERLREADGQYTIYETNFAARVRSYADANLDKIFAQCIAEVSAKDPQAGKLLKSLKTFDASNATIGSALADHQPTIQRTIIDDFNSGVVRELRALPSELSFSNWMSLALKEWTSVDNKDSKLVERCVSELVGDRDLLGGWVKAYVRQDLEPDHWNPNPKGDPTVNRRLHLLQELDRYVGIGLNKGRDEVLAIVKRNYLTDSPIRPKEQ